MLEQVHGALTRGAISEALSVADSMKHRGMLREALYAYTAIAQSSSEQRALCTSPEIHKCSARFTPPNSIPLCQRRRAS